MSGPQSDVAATAVFGDSGSRDFNEKYVYDMTVISEFAGLKWPSFMTKAVFDACVKGGVIEIEPDKHSTETTRMVWLVRDCVSKIGEMTYDSDRLRFTAPVVPFNAKARAAPPIPLYAVTHKKGDDKQDVVTIMTAAEANA